MRQRSAAGDVVATSATQVLTLILSTASLAIISRRLGEADLGLYTLERRAMALLQPLVLLGLTVATPRYIALSLERDDRRHGGFAVAGGVLVCALAAALGALVIAVPEPAARLFFADPDGASLARALGGFVFATAAYQAVYAVFRGYLKMARANLLELAVVGALPATLAAVGPTDVVDLMWLLNAGILLATVAAVATTAHLAVAGLPRTAGSLADRGRLLLRYGIARTPGDAAVVALFSLAPIAVVHWAGPTEAGYTSIVQSGLALVTAVAVPVSVILLPRAARAAAAGTESDVAWRRLAQATIDLGLVLAGVVFLASPALVAVLVPTPPPSLILAQRVAALGVVGYVIHLVLRSYLDAVDYRPLSSISTIAAFAFFALALPIALEIGGPPAVVLSAGALAVSLTLMGALTMRLVAGRLPGLRPLASCAPAATCLAAMVAVGALAGHQAPLMAAGQALAGLVASFIILLAARRPWLLAVSGGSAGTAQPPLAEAVR